MPTVQLNVRITAETRQLIAKLQDDTGRTIAEVIESAVKLYSADLDRKWAEFHGNVVL